jgi:predicted transposase YbfD/YdcC
VAENQLKSLKDFLYDLHDPRAKPAKRHELLSIIIIAVCAMICGADNWVDIAEFGESKLEWFKTFLYLPNGISSHDTFGRVFSLLDPKEFEHCFLLWATSLRKAIEGQHVAIDGKSLRRSHDEASGKTPVNMVSAWVSENQLVLGQLKVREGSNEITAIPPLLRMLFLKGCIVTIDAIATHKEIVDEIRNQGADYVLTLKGNQGTLYEGVEDSFTEGRKTDFKDIAHDYYQTIDKGHGRIEVRQYWTITEPEYLSYLDPKEEWRDLRCIGMVDAERNIKGEISREIRYYISSLSGNAKEFGEAVRSHWGIENSVHWILDVVFGEDYSRVREGYAAENLATLRRLSLNLIQQEATFRKSVKGRRLKACWDENYLLQLLTSV